MPTLVLVLCSARHVAVAYTRSWRAAALAVILGLILLGPARSDDRRLIQVILEHDNVLEA